MPTMENESNGEEDDLTAYYTRQVRPDLPIGDGTALAAARTASNEDENVHTDGHHYAFAKQFHQLQSHPAGSSSTGIPPPILAASSNTIEQGEEDKKLPAAAPSSDTALPPSGPLSEQLPHKNVSLSSDTATRSQDTVLMLPPTSTGTPLSMGVRIDPGQSAAVQAAEDRYRSRLRRIVETDEFREIREQDRYLPFHNIEKIMKKTPTLPPKAKISKESVKMMQEVISEFISFLTSEAHEQCTENNRKTINAHELLWAMSKLGFERYVGPLKEYMDKYNNG